MKHLALVVLWMVGAGVVVGQQPLSTADPLYQSEGIARTVYDRLALSGEISYRPAGLLVRERRTAPGRSPIGLWAQVDYALLPNVDLGAHFDVQQPAGHGPLGLAWLIVKPHWYNDGAEYAVRLAIDPVSEGRAGFRQIDVAFLSTADLSPDLTSDFAVGFRRVRLGYDATAFPFDGSDGLDTLAFEARGRSRLSGTELRVHWGYNLLLDPGGSRLFASLLAEGASYQVLTTRAMQDAASDAWSTAQQVRTGIGWLRAGIQLRRPAYQIGPYVALPLLVWGEVQGAPVRYGPRPEKTHFGLRLTVR